MTNVENFTQATEAIWSPLPLVFALVPLQNKSFGLALLKMKFQA